jgi:hypothetical protein
MRGQTQDGIDLATLRPVALELPYAGVQHYRCHLWELK